VDVRLAAAVFVDPEGRTLLLPPPSAASSEDAVQAEVYPLLSRMWHFPTITVRKEALRELRQHLLEALPGVPAAALPFAAANPVKHGVTYRNIVIQPFVGRVKTLPKIKGARKLPLRDLSAVAISNLTRKVAAVALQSITD
jgi:hypothetical protein